MGILFLHGVGVLIGITQVSVMCNEGEVDGQDLLELDDN